jgi:hypothetical protein
LLGFESVSLSLLSQTSQDKQTRHKVTHIALPVLLDKTGSYNCNENERNRAQKHDFPLLLSSLHHMAIKVDN